MARERHSHGFQVARRLPHDRQVDLVQIELAHHRLAVVHRQPELDLRMAARELRQQLGREVLGRAHHADAQQAPAQALEGGESVVRLLQRAQRLARVAQQLFARLSQVQALAQPLEQRQPGTVLELSNLHRDRRLGQVQLGRGAREAQAVGGRHEDLQLPQGDVAHPWHV